MAITEKEIRPDTVRGQCLTVIDIGVKAGKRQYVFKNSRGEILQFLITFENERSVFPGEIHVNDKVTFFTGTEGKDNKIVCKVLQAQGRPVTLSNIRAITALYDFTDKSSAAPAEKQKARAAIDVLGEYTGYSYYLFQTESKADRKSSIILPLPSGFLSGEKA